MPCKHRILNQVAVCKINSSFNSIGIKDQRTCFRIGAWQTQKKTIVEYLRSKAYMFYLKGYQQGLARSQSITAYLKRVKEHRTHTRREEDERKYRERKHC